MGAPMRLSAGFTQHTSFQPFGLLGIPDPLFYAQDADDFLPFVAAGYTETNTGNGSVAATAGDGGRILFTTNSTTPAATDISSIQRPVANLTLSAGKKWTYAVRLQLSDATNAALVAGLIQTTTTPFTVTDGVYFGKASGQTSPTIYVVSGSTVQKSLALSGVALTNATDIDLVFTYDGKADLLVFAGSGLFGQVTDNNRATLGPTARIADVGSLTLTAANLNPTLAIQSGTATSKTMNADFLMAAKER